MTRLEAVLRFCERRSWSLVEIIDLGTTACVYVVETDKDSQRYALKTQRDSTHQDHAVRTEYRVLEYLNATPMQQVVPRIGDWLPELDGFLMDLLRYPTLAEMQAPAWALDLGRALRMLHSLDLPTIATIPDDRPNVADAVSHRFRLLFQHVLREDDYWTHLPQADRPKLAHVRARYDAYAGLLPKVQRALANSEPALTHGDLAGDNIMLTYDGRLALADWGTARVSSPLNDVANLLTYANWSEDESGRFLRAYFDDDPAALKAAWPCLQDLSHLHRYRSCVQSLQWLNEMGEQGLDGVGRAHLERILNLL
jgi:aminoglycoside phosphotransferase (APT) family kinase protein